MPSQESKTLIAMSLQLGFSVALPTAGLAYIGHRIDVARGTNGVFLMIGLGLALAISLLLVLQIVKLALHKLSPSNTASVSKNPDH